MSSMFSSPSKSAQQAASSVQGVDQGMLNQAIAQYNQEQQSARGAIAGLGQNPYFAAAQGMNPLNYRVNPQGTQTFGASGAPGTYLGQLQNIGNAYAQPGVQDPFSQARLSARAGGFGQQPQPGAMQGFGQYQNVPYMPLGPPRAGGPGAGRPLQ